MATARTPAAKKTAAKKTAPARKRAEPKVEILSAPVVKKTEPPKLIPADKVAEVYHKVAKENDWCDDGQTSVKAALKTIGVDVNEDPKIQHIFTFLQVSDITPQLISYGEIREADLRRVLREIHNTLTEAFPHGIKVTVPIGTTGRTGSVTVTFDVKRRPMQSGLYTEVAGLTL